jgi:hypothetical protein
VTGESKSGPPIRHHWPGTGTILFGGPTALQKEMGSYSNYVAQTLAKVHEYEKQHPNAFKPVKDSFAKTEAQILWLYKQRPDLEKSMGPLKPFDIEDYHVRVGMHQDTLIILYGKPTRIQKNPRKSDADEAWVYDYPDGVRRTYFLKNHIVSRIVGASIEFI